jgi:hypothetical protein
MKSCPYCESELNWKTVKFVRPAGTKWYQYSGEPFLRRTCSYCRNELVQEFNEHWRYKVASLIYLPLLVLGYIFVKNLSLESKVIWVLLLVICGVIATVRAFDYQYITVGSQQEKRIKSLIDNANGYIENPIEFNEYCKKYSITQAELMKKISLGLVEAYAIEGKDFLDDIAPK